MEEISNFIKTIMQDDLDNGRVQEIVTRFPPEPNAFLHIGHARAIITSFTIAKAFNGYTNLRFDDTNPVKEDQRFIDGIIEDLRWLGFEPKNIFYGSDYFEDAYEKAILLIKKGLAFVDDLSKEEMAKYRGSFEEAGKNSPYRDRSVSENLELFENMKNGAYNEGEKVLRAKIDMASPNLNMRDPILYRILKAHHHRQGEKWCIYPMYDYAHPLQDAYEGITHSLCSLEFDNHRPLYDWVVLNTEASHTPHQYEFGRLNINGMMMSKRYLKQLVDTNMVIGYDDPRMSTLRGLKRRGFTPEAIKAFILSTGLSRVNSTTDYGMLEHFLREDLKLKASRKMAIINPLKVVITNYEEGKIEYLPAENNSENEELGTREVAFGKYLSIDRDDFIEEKPNKKWKRLAKDVEVRLMHAYFVKCNEVIKDSEGNITEIHCTYDVETKSGSGFTDRKPNGNIHYVESTTALAAKFNYFKPLIDDDMDPELNFMDRLTKDSWIVKEGFVEASFKDTKPLDNYQFMRTGYFTTDADSKSDDLIFNCTCELKSSFK